MVFLPAFLVSVLPLLVQAGTTVWSGSFNAYSTATDFDAWSWSNEVGEYQWYIHGSQPTSHYLALDPSYKNPADTSEVHGLKVTIDSTATWNSNMERTELIPQTTANLGTGELFYHFSVMHSSTNPPNSTVEHQIVFFESHFTELKYGVGPNNMNLEWMIQGNPQWDTPFTPGVWYNFAYDINFTAGTVGLWASTGGDSLQRVVSNLPASTSTNSEDWHLGVLRIQSGPDPEDWYFSGVYIETGPITTAIGSDPGTVSSLSASTTITSPPTSASATATLPSSAPQQTQYGQCGGTNWTGPIVCTEPYTCIAVSAPYYYQCQ